MILIYTDTLTGTEKSIELTEFNQDLHSRYFQADCVTVNGHFYTINKYKHLWSQNKVIGTNARVEEIKARRFEKRHIIHE